jgi:WD40 repeat protein
MGTPVATPAAHTRSVGAIVFSPDVKLVLTGSEDNTARLWDAAPGTIVAALAGHAGLIFAVAFSPGGKRIVTGSGDNAARLACSSTAT